MAEPSLMSQPSPSEVPIAQRPGPSASPAIGDAIGRDVCGCIIASRLPAHRLGERWLARRRRDREPFVLYRLAHARAAAGVGWPRMLARLRDLHDRHVLTVVDGALDADGSVWLRSPYPGTYEGMLSITGLLARKERGRLASTEAEVAVRQVLSACARAHERGVEHGPIHPDEVLVDRMAMVRLECYGVERELNGRPGSVDAAVAAELRSIGSLAHLMVLGALPGPGWERTLRREPGVSRRWSAWIAGALNVDGFATAREALAALDAGR